MIKCSYCDNVIADDDEHFKTKDGEIICDVCKNDYYVTCENCDEIVLIEDSIVVEDSYYCSDCADELFFICDRCGNYHSRDNRYYIEDRQEDWCQACFEDNAWCCDNCGNYYSYDVASDGDYYCPDCHEDNGHDLINAEECIEFFPDTYPRKHIGVEFEVDRLRDKDPDIHQCVEDIINTSLEGHVYFKTDGSLEEGLEIVSQPHHLNYYLEGGEFDLDTLRSICLKNGLYSHNTRTCGLHMHFSREWWKNVEAIAKTLLFFDKWWEDIIVPFSRRKNFNYCEPTPKSASYMYFAQWGMGDRYHAVNLSNDATIEFRVAKGSLNVKTIRATMQFYAHIIEKSNTLSWNEADILENWMNGMPENVLEYLKGRNANVKEND